MSHPGLVARGKPRLTVVRGSHAPIVAAPLPDWRGMAAAVLSCTHELNHHLRDQRWVRVDEVLRERRELLAGLARMSLDVEARGCVRALEQAADESEAAVYTMMGRALRRQ